MTSKEAWEELRRRWLSVEMFADTDADKEYAEALDVALNALERDRWISVEERLPERNTEVLVYAIGDADGFWGEHVIVIAKRFLFKFFPSDEGEEKWSSPWQYFHTDYRITHWKPLPKPPKEET